MSVPARLAGLRTMFNSFHHFRPADATAILRSAVAAGQPIGVFEVSNRSLRTVLTLILTPLFVFIATLFIRPFRWDRLLWTSDPDGSLDVFVGRHRLATSGLHPCGARSAGCGCGPGRALARGLGAHRVDTGASHVLLGYPAESRTPNDVPCNPVPARPVGRMLSDGNPVTPGGAAPVRADADGDCRLSSRLDSHGAAGHGTLSADHTRVRRQADGGSARRLRRQTGELRCAVLRADERRAAASPRISVRPFSNFVAERPRLRRRPQRERHPARLAGIRTLVGAFSRSIPGRNRGRSSSRIRRIPATAGLGDRFTLTEEFYTFVENPRPPVHVLLRLDAASVGATGDYPLAWCALVRQRPRVLQRARPLFGDLDDPRFQRQLVGAIRWAAGTR